MNYEWKIGLLDFTIWRIGLLRTKKDFIIGLLSLLIGLQGYYNLCLLSMKQ